MLAGKPPPRRSPAIRQISQEELWSCEICLAEAQGSPSAGSADCPACTQERAQWFIKDLDSGKVVQVAEAEELYDVLDGFRGASPPISDRGGETAGTGGRVSGRITGSRVHQVGLQVGLRAGHDVGAASDRDTASEEEGTGQGQTTGSSSSPAAMAAMLTRVRVEGHFRRDDHTAYRVVVEMGGHTSG